MFATSFISPILRNYAGEPYTSWDAVRQANASAGHHYFESGTMRFFRSRLIGRPVISTDCRRIFFATSEKSPHGARAYSVRVMDAETGYVETVGEFMQYTKGQISTAVRRAVAAYNLEAASNA